MSARGLAAALLAAAFWMWLLPAQAATLRLTDAPAFPLMLDSRVDWLKDPTTQLTLAAADALPSGPGGFQPGTPERMRPGLSDAAYWLRFTLVNDSATVRPMRLILDATWLQYVDFHVLRQGPQGAPAAAWSHEAAGVSAPPRPWAVRDRVPTLALDLLPGERARVLVRVQSQNNVKLSPWLHTADSWRSTDSRYGLFNGLVIGGLLVLAAYSFALWFPSRRPAMLVQGLVLALFALYAAAYHGQAYLALWPDSTEWSYRAAGVLGNGCALAVVAYLYTLTLRSPVRPPGLPLLGALTVVQALVCLGMLTGPYRPFATISILNTVLLLLSLSISSFFYMRRAGPGGRVAFPVMLVVTLGACLRLAELTATTRLMRSADTYVLAFPSLLVGLVALASWAHHLARQRHKAQHMLVQWQAQEQQRLSDEVARKTRALNAALAQAEHHAQEQARLMAYIGHDLRAPLATIVGQVQMLRSDLGSKPEQLQAIERNAGYQLALVDDLLEYARGELLPFALELQPVRLPALIDDIAQYGATLAQRQNNRFVLEPPAGLPPAVLIDSKRFQQLLLNLLSNAAKFTRDGQIGLHVEAQAASASQWRLSLEVRDTGIGIDPAHQQRMFQAFEQADPSADGHGLGLAIARRIATQMGGELQLDSQLGLGTRIRFAVVVDVAPESAAPVIAPPVPTPLPAQPAPQRRRRRTRPVAAMAPLPEAVRAELETLAREGRWSDLHEWADRLAHSTRHKALVRAVRQALEALDFEHIRHLARATPSAPDHGT